MTASVSPGYLHRDKICAPGEAVRAGDARLKWYDIAPTGAPVSPNVCTLAREFVARLEVPGELGFVILHRCGDQGFYFLLLQTWRNDNELWESVYAKQSDADPGFALFPLPGPHRGTFCVWELGAVWREQQAWLRYLGSDRTEPAKLAYLSELYAGSV